MATITDLNKFRERLQQQFADDIVDADRNPDDDRERDKLLQTLNHSSLPMWFSCRRLHRLTATANVKSSQVSSASGLDTA